MVGHHVAVPQLSVAVLITRPSVPVHLVHRVNLAWVENVDLVQEVLVLELELAQPGREYRVSQEMFPCYNRKHWSILLGH